MDKNSIQRLEEKIMPINEIDSTELVELFPIVELSDNELRSAKKIPLTSLGALGAAFSQMPEAARTIVTTTTSSIATEETLFVGINPNGIAGYLLQNEHGTVGNIMQINEKGQKFIAGRMRFKPVDKLPVTNATSTVVPYDPTLMVVAVAMYTVEKKLDGIKTSIDNVLDFLENDKRAKQRGNLRQLDEIAQEYKRKGKDTEFCNNRNIIVQQIKLEAMGNIEFYKHEISEGMSALEKMKKLHLTKDADSHLNEIRRQFIGYQLACYLYAYSNFMDLVLRDDFEDSSINNCCEKIKAIGMKYDALYSECRTLIATYQRSTIENKILGGVGKTADTLGRAIGNIPIIEKGPVNDLLVDAGQAIKGVNKKAVETKIDAIEVLENNHMNDFLDGIEMVGALKNRKNQMVIDGTNLYIVDTAV